MYERKTKNIQDQMNILTSVVNKRTERKAHKANMKLELIYPSLTNVLNTLYRTLGCHEYNNDLYPNQNK